MNCIETVGLTYRFSSRETVLKELNLRVPEGAIYGFLGKNGAGKTTTLKLLLGLLKKQEGSISIFGKEFSKNRIEILARTGSLIESPSFYAHLSALENLHILQRVYRCAESRCAEVLELVGLADTGKKKVSQFSLGMKQRLSIAIALLHAPQLLILDEPTNGLDPNGIIDIRELLKKINAEFGTTILVSSHLLAEVEKLVTDIGIIHQGSLLYQGSIDGLKEKQTASSGICFEVNDVAKAKTIFSAAAISTTSTDSSITIPDLPNATIAALNAQLVNQGIAVHRITAQSKDLEALFIDLINN